MSYTAFQDKLRKEDGLASRYVGLSSVSPDKVSLQGHCKRLLERLGSVGTMFFAPQRMAGCICLTHLSSSSRNTHCQCCQELYYEFPSQMAKSAQEST